LKKLREIDQIKPSQSDQEPLKLIEGMEVEHARFGTGIVQSIEGNGNDKKSSNCFQRLWCQKPFTSVCQT